MSRPFAMLCLVFAAGGCVIVQPHVTNPLPNVTRVAVVPFANHSVEPALDTVLVTNAYYAELQQVPGFEVVPISVTAKAIESFGLRMQSPRDALELARVLDVDAVVVGAITDYDPYSPPRIGWHVEWYSPTAPDFARGIPVDPRLRPDVPSLPRFAGDCQDGDCPADGPGRCTTDEVPNRTARGPRKRPGARSTVPSDTVFRGQSPREWNRTRPGTDDYETVRRVFRPRLLRPGHAYSEANGVRPATNEQSAEDRGRSESIVDDRGPAGTARSPREHALFPHIEWNHDERTTANGPLAEAEPPFPFEREVPRDRRPVRTVAGELPHGLEPLFPDSADNLDSTYEDSLPPWPAPAVADADDLERPPTIDAPAEAPRPGGDEESSRELPPPANVPTLDSFGDRPELGVAPQRDFETGPAEFDRAPPLPTLTFGLPAPPPPFDPQEPIMAFTRVYDGRDQDLLARLRDYYELNGDERAGGWRGYLQRSDDFIRFTAHVAIVEMLTLHGGETRRRYVWKLRTRS